MRSSLRGPGTDADAPLGARAIRRNATAPDLLRRAALAAEALRSNWTLGRPGAENARQFPAASSVARETLARQARPRGVSHATSTGRRTRSPGLTRTGDR